MGKEFKRMRYFDGLFLNADDYKLDQEYQKRLQQLHSRYLHTWGIVAGLDVKPSGEDLKVVVTEGLALNQVTSEENGESISQQIYINDGHPDSIVDLSQYDAGENIYIFVSYEEALQDRDDLEKGKGQEIHIWERGRIGHSNVKPADEKKFIVLARVVLEWVNNKKHLNADGIKYYEANETTSVRTYAGPAGRVLALEKIIFKLEEELTGMPYIKALDQGAKGVGLEINSTNTNFIGSVNVQGDLVVYGNLENEGAAEQELLVSNCFVQVNSKSDEVPWVRQDGGLEVYRGETETSPDARLIWSEAEGWWKVGFGNDIWKIAYGPLWERLIKKDFADDLHKHKMLWSGDKVALETDTAGNLAVYGNLGMNDRTIWLRGQDNVNNGLGWFGGNKLFAGLDVDGPVLFGHKGGALGTTDGGQKSVVSWNSLGNVGIGVQNPKDDQLEVADGLRILSQSNPLRFTSVWSGFPDSNTNCAEISNDTSYHKALMIVGNQSAGQGRKVAIWDRLDVNGFLYVNGNMQLSQALTPSSGNGKNGIIFPGDPGGGAGDSAWLKYYARSGEACTLEIGTSNDADDNIALMASGNVGIGTAAPEDKLDVKGGMRILSGTNPIRFTSGWSGFPDQAVNRAEICNDTANYKSLMIVGNRSGGSGRKVSVWDRLDVNGLLNVNGDIQTLCAIVPSVGSGENNGIMFPRDYYGGSGDAAWIKYYSDTRRGGGENMTLEIGISNDVGTGGYYGGGDRIRLYASGGVYVDGYFYYSSSRDLKENISALSVKKAKQILDGMNPVSFNFRGDAEKTTYGFIAEEVPAAVAAKDQKAISPIEIIAVLTSVVKDQRKAIADLQKQIDTLPSKR